jgi:formylglycine-generating enzyme required for sulfatase activity
LQRVKEGESSSEPRTTLAPCMSYRRALASSVPVQRSLQHAADARTFGLLLSGAAVIGVVATLAVRRHSNPSRCSDGWVSTGPRCCAVGQSCRSGNCTGVAKNCPTGFHQPTGAEGCVVDPRRIRIGSVNLSIGPNDWQSEQVIPIVANVPPFFVDATEVTHEQWLTCVMSKQCRSLESRELGQPVTGVTPEDAQGYCASVQGRLPKLNERMALAAGAQSRRFPWGQTGLVCRRATYGIIAGPCAEGGNQPDIAGIHADGKSPEGVLDLSGNVAELALDAEGRTWVCGGSFRSRTALELKSWACALWTKPADDIGFRCVYDTSG